MCEALLNKFFSNPAIVSSLSGCRVKSTPLLGNFGWVVRKDRRRREKAFSGEKKMLWRVKIFVRDSIGAPNLSVTSTFSYTWNDGN